MTFDELMNSFLNFWNTPEGQSSYFLEQSNDGLWSRIRVTTAGWLKANLTQIPDLKEVRMICDLSNNQNDVPQTHLDLHSISSNGDNCLYRFTFQGVKATLSKPGA